MNCINCTFASFHAHTQTHSHCNIVIVRRSRSLMATHIPMSGLYIWYYCGRIYFLCTIFASRLRVRLNHNLHFILSIKPIFKISTDFLTLSLSRSPAIRCFLFLLRLLRVDCRILEQIEKSHKRDARHCRSILLHYSMVLVYNTVFCGPVRIHTANHFSFILLLKVTATMLSTFCFKS